jgi:very-short-patch-repair endonuclease
MSPAIIDTRTAEEGSMKKKDLQPSKHVVLQARQLRRRATFPERLLWGRLRDRRLGLKFRRQHPIGPYVVDFFCAEAPVAVELDGRSHEDQASYDAQRDRWLKERGVTLLRFPHDRLLQDFDAVLDVIWATCVERMKDDEPPKYAE